MTRYTPRFFRGQQDASLRSGREVVPVVLDLVKPASVVDVGCGVGTWLAVFREHGIQDLLGIDGAYVDTDMLHVSRDCFRKQDLRKRFDLGRRFDLALSMEVAEHLPASAAEVFVDNLTRLSPVVLFSAAIPFQGGEDHRNEQWATYWVHKFEERGFVAIDCIRRRIWNNTAVAWPYVQNSLVFAERKRISADSVLREAYERTDPDMLSVVHPRALEHMRFKSAVKVLGAATYRAIRRRLGLAPTRSALSHHA